MTVRGDAAWPAVRERFSTRRVFTATEIADFAARCGDFNPLHHDTDLAARSRFGGIIASGPQTTAVFMALVGSHFTVDYDAVGLEFSFRFVKAVRAGVEVRMTWTITGVAPAPDQRRADVTLAGEAVDPEGTLLIAATGRSVLWPKARPAT